MPKKNGKKQAKSNLKAIRQMAKTANKSYRDWGKGFKATKKRAKKK